MPASVIPMATSGCLCSRSTSRTEFFKSQAGLLRVGTILPVEEGAWLQHL
jgi:hypothetical protein